MPKAMRAVLTRIAALRAERAAGSTATPRWKRFAASTALLLLVAALVATILLTSGLGPQPASAAPPCENGTVVPNPADHPGLADDCAVLLAVKDALAGTAALNWSATTPITDWTGITVSRAPKRVTKLNLDSMSLNGSIPAELSGLSALRELRLAWNRLTGTIPPELGQLTQLAQLVLGGNRLTGAIPPELGSIGATLTTLQLSGPNPLPTGIGLSGSIPPQLGNLTGLQQLWLNGNRLTGTIPTRLGRLTNLIGLHLDKNQLSGSIPTQLGALSNLTDLQLQDNQLTGPLPSQLGGLTQLNKIYLLRNAGFSGCVPLPLRRVRYHHFDWLGLPDCAADAPTPRHARCRPTPDRYRRRRRQRRPGRRDHARRGRRGHPDSELERRDPHLRGLGRRLQWHGHDLHAHDVHGQDSDGVVHRAGSGPLCHGDQRRLHPRRLSRRAERLRPGPGHPRGAAARAGQ